MGSFAFFFKLFRVEYSPSDYDGKSNTPHLHISKIPANKYLAENMVIKMEFNDINDFLDSAKQALSNIIL